MKNQFQKIALLLGAILVVAVVAYYFKNGKGSPVVNSNSGVSSDADNSLRPPPGGSLISSPPMGSSGGTSSSASTANTPLPDQSLASPGAPPPGASLLSTPPEIGPAPAAPPGATTLPASGEYRSAATEPLAVTAPAARDLSNDYPPLAQAENRTYTIKAGDTFSIIAKAIYHDSARWKEIAQANPTVDPIKLKIGQIIKLPDLSASDAGEARQSATPTAAAEGTATGRKPRKEVMYTVEYGDTLSTIARHFYRDRSLGKLIYQANRKLIGAAPDDLTPGTKLVIPPAPQASH